MGEFNQVIKDAFSRVKEDISLLGDKITLLEEKMKHQDDEMSKILSKLDEILRQQENIKSDVSMRSDGLKQLSDQSHINQSFKQLSTSDEIDEMPFKQDKNEKYDVSTGNKGVKQSINHLSANQSISQSFKQLSNQSNETILTPKIENLRQNLDSIFFQLSKQELKLFLLIYQLEDDGVQVTNKALSLKMQLSEPCIRSHLSSLLKKGAPIIKKRVGNRTNLLSVLENFRALGLKSKLIELFYDSDPHQRTLFHF